MRYTILHQLLSSKLQNFGCFAQVLQFNGHEFWKIATEGRANQADQIGQTHSLQDISNLAWSPLDRGAPRRSDNNFTLQQLKHSTSSRKFARLAKLNRSGPGLLVCFCISGVFSYSPPASTYTPQFDCLFVYHSHCMASLPALCDAPNSKFFWGAPDPNLMPNRLPDKISEYMSDRMLEYMPDKMSEYRLGNRSEYMSHKMSEFMPLRGSHEVKSLLCFWCCSMFSSYFYFVCLFFLLFLFLLLLFFFFFFFFLFFFFLFFFFFFFLFFLFFFFFCFFFFFFSFSYCSFSCFPYT